MRENNGFIATSILYAFLLSFLTLFLAYMANYIQNKQLLDQVKLMAQDEMETYNNTYITDLEIGDYVVFDTISRESGSDGNTVYESLINDSSRWILFDISSSGEDTVYSFVSDINAQNYGLIYNFIPEEEFSDGAYYMKKYPDGGGKNGFTSINLNTMYYYMFGSVYYKSVGIYYTREKEDVKSNDYTLYRYSFPYTQNMSVEFLTNEHLQKIFNTYDDSLMNAILDQESSFLYWDKTEVDGSEKGFTMFERVGFAGFAGEGVINGSDPDAINASCQADENFVKYEDGKLKVYNDTSNFKYAHLNRESEHTYVDYCYYKGESYGTCATKPKKICGLFGCHNSNILTDRGNKICTSDDGEYPIRFVANLTIEKDDSNTNGYVDSGNGTAQLPYLITSGIKYGGYDER